MSIFNRPFNKIVWQDLDMLLTQGVSESEVLEYKEKYDAGEAAKVISAFANTFGGLLIYGIKSDPSTNKPKSVDGVEGNRLEDSIDSVCYDAITPPLLCHSRYISNPDGNNRCFIVSVPESDLAPHAIDHNRTVYIKVKAQKRPLTDRANLDQVAWLSNRREKSRSFRRDLLSGMGHRISRLCQPPTSAEYALTVTVVPRFPGRLLVSLDQLKCHVDLCITRYRKTHPGTLVGSGRQFHYDYGICQRLSYSDIRLFLDFNCFGLRVFRVINRKEQGEKGLLRIDHLGNQLLIGMRFMLESLSSADFCGILLVHCSIEPILGSKLFQNHPLILDSETMECEIEQKLEHESAIDSRNLDSDIESCFEAFFERLLFAFGVRSELTESVADLYQRCSKEYYQHDPSHAD